eukprot:XP_001691409.1 predicted protein [Chlamydomonas reinhardtii]
MGLRMKVPFNPIYDINSASANLNTDPSRLIPPPPPPLAITNYSYTINRNAQVLRSTVLIDDLLNVTTAASNGSDAASGAFNFTQVKSTFARDFSNDIDMSMSGYIMSQDISFPDYGLVQSCTSADVQAVINKIAAKYGVSPDSIAASCQYDYKKPDAVTTVTAAHRRRRGRSLQQTTVTTPAVCYPRISITVSMPLGVPMDGNVTKALAAATTAADAVYDAVGTDACYVPTGAESRVGTVVAFTTTNSKATCEYITQAFANAGNFTADMIRTYNCGEENPKKPYPPGLIALWCVLGVLGVVVIGVVTYLGVSWRKRRAANLQFVNQEGAISGGLPKVAPSPSSLAMGGNDYKYSTKAAAVAEGLQRPDTPTRYSPRAAVPAIERNRVVPV